MRMQDYLEKAVRRGADRPAFIQADGSASITYRQVYEQSQRIAAAIAQTGVADQARAAVYCPNDARAFVLLMGILRSGAVWVPLNVRHPVAATAHMLELTGCRFLFFHSSLAQEVAELRKTVPSIEFAICIDAQLPEAPSLEAFIADADGEPPEIADDPDRVVTIFPTGGTTGLSKGAAWSQATWEGVISTFWTSMPHPGPRVHLVAGPMTHAAGGLALMMLPGAPTNIVMAKPEPLAIMQAIERHRVTDLYLPPTLVYLMLAHPDVRKYDYSSLRHFVIAAAPMAPDRLREAMGVFGPVMCQSYGQTEAPMLVTFMSTAELLEQAEPAGPGQDRYASCGRPTLGTRLGIMDDDGRLLPAGSKGEIVVRGCLVFDHYYRNPEATEAARLHGWHHTGDIGYEDEDGFVYIVDRKKDMIITGGFNVYSAEVEQTLMGHPAVQECAVIGVPDDKWGEAILAVVELKPDANASEDELISFVKTRLGSVQTPKHVAFWPELPRSANGKVLKVDIRARFWQGQSRSVA